MPEQNNIQKLIENVVEKTKKKYEKYNDYLSQKFYNKLQTQLFKYYNKDMTVSPDVGLKLIASNLVIKELSRQIKKGNIEIEIELIEEYKNMLKWIMLKKNIENEIYLKKGEDIIMYAFETYDGNKNFLTHLYNCVKIKCKDDIKENIIDKKINRYIETEYTYVEPTYLDLVGKELDILKYITKKASIMYEFIYLKYGYKYDRYFSLIEISKILNISMEDVKKYYKESITLLKGAVDLYLQTNQDEKIKYAQKLLQK